MDVIVSAVQGGPDVIVDGPATLAEAGRRNGVRRILPSDYALDLFKATPGEHVIFDLRRTAGEAIAATGIDHIHVLQGGFMELFGPGMGAFDYDASTVAFWGDGIPLKLPLGKGQIRCAGHGAVLPMIGEVKAASRHSASLNRNFNRYPATARIVAARAAHLRAS